MGFLNFGKKKETETKLGGPLHSEFSSPFGKVGTGDLSLPYVRAYGKEPYIRFGNDNLFPQLINQMKYQSALNGSIIDYKSNAVIGGGFEIDGEFSTGPEKVKEYKFIKKNKIVKLSRQITKDLIMHGRICLLINRTEDGVSVKRMGPEKVRNNEDKTMYTTSTDWFLSTAIHRYPEYTPTRMGESMYVYEIDDEAGQDIYPLPQYISSMNDCFLDGQISYLQKSNIINSVFPSFMIKVAKNFDSKLELQQFKDTIEKAKGAPEAGRIMTFVANDVSQLPTIESIPGNQNDKIFDSTLSRVDANICRAHQIDPLLTGIRVAGSLGSGNELKESYVIFEKNVILPIRTMVEECLNEVLTIGEIKSNLVINNFQIVDGEIIDSGEIK
jgi:hypothetical protein